MLAVSLNNLIRRSQQRLRDGDAKRLGGLEVDDEFEFRRLLHGEVGRLFAFENAADIDANLVERIVEAAAIAHQAAGEGELTVFERRGQRMAGRQRRDLFHAPEEEAARADQDRINALLRKICKGRFEIATSS